MLHWPWDHITIMHFKETDYWAKKAAYEDGKMEKLALCKPYAVASASLFHVLFSHRWITCEQ